MDCPLCGSADNPKFDAATSDWCVPCSKNEIRVQTRSEEKVYNPYSARWPKNKQNSKHA